MLKRVSTFYLLCVLFLLGSATPSHAWLGYHKPEFKGRVIDAETKEPIEGAVVVAVYSKKAIRIAPESVSIIINVKETLTDKDGNFVIPSYTTIIDPLSWSQEVDFIIFKPGYGSFPDGRIMPPRGMNLDITWDEFFSGKMGEIREVSVEEPWKRDSKTWTEKVAFGVVELPKLKTRGERLRATPGHITDEIRKTPILNRIIEEEDKALGLK